MRKGQATSEETKAKQRASAIARWEQPGAREKLSAALRGVPRPGAGRKPGFKVSEETRKKMSAAKKGVPNPNAGRKPGFKLSEETKQKMREKRLAYWTPERRLAQSLARRGSKNQAFGRHWKWSKNSLVKTANA